MQEKISYAKTVYGQEEIDAVIKCLNESTQMGKYSREFEKKIALSIDVRNEGNHDALDVDIEVRPPL